MIEHQAPQGSDEWHNARAGCITASMFSVARSKVGLLTAQQQRYVDLLKSGGGEKYAREAAGYKAAPTAAGIATALAGGKVGEFSDAAKNYAFTLAVERISGKPLDDGFETWQMRRGHELEPLARMAHEDVIQDMVRQVGFVSTDDGKFGGSADGFRFSNGNGCEYKCFLSPEKLRAILFDGDISGVADQCQGGLWLTGSKEWELGFYCPALEPVGRQFTLFVLQRDEDYIERLEGDLIEFDGLVCSYVAKLKCGGTKHFTTKPQSNARRETAAIPESIF